MSMAREALAGHADELGFPLQREMLTFTTPNTRLQCAACIAACPVGKGVAARFWWLDPERG